MKYTYRSWLYLYRLTSVLLRFRLSDLAALLVPPHLKALERCALYHLLVKILLKYLLQFCCHSFYYAVDCRVVWVVKFL